MCAYLLFIVPSVLMVLVLLSGFFAWRFAERRRQKALDEFRQRWGAR